MTTSKLEILILINKLTLFKVVSYVITGNHRILTTLHMKCVVYCEQELLLKSQL